MNDCIEIHALVVEMSIGAYTWEKQVRQRVTVDVMLECDTSDPGKSDRLEDAIDYTKVADAIQRMSKARHYTLIESFSEVVAENLLSIAGIDAVQLTVTKPGAIVGAGAVSVTIKRRA